MLKCNINRLDVGLAFMSIQTKMAKMNLITGRDRFVVSLKLPELDYDDALFLYLANLAQFNDISSLINSGLSCITMITLFLNET